MTDRSELTALHRANIAAYEDKLFRMNKRGRDPFGMCKKCGVQQDQPHVVDCPTLWGDNGQVGNDAYRQRQAETHPRLNGIPFTRVRYKNGGRYKERVIEIITAYSLGHSDGFNKHDELHLNRGQA